MVRAPRAPGGDNIFAALRQEVLRQVVEQESRISGSAIGGRLSQHCSQIALAEPSNGYRPVRR